MKRNLLLILTLTFLYSISYAGEISYSHRVTGFGIGQNVSVNSLLAIPNESHNDDQVVNVITLGVDHESLTAFSEKFYELRITMNILKWDVNGVQLPTVVESFSISYDPTNPKGYVDKAYYKFNDAYKVNCIVTNVEANTTGYGSSNFAPVSPLPLSDNFYISNEILVYRYFNMGPVIGNSITNIQNNVKSCQTNSQSYDTDLSISWNTFLQAEEYQLEYCFIDNHLDNPSNATYDFKNNSTRISTTNTSYDIPIIGQMGHLVYRIRPVGRDYQNPQIPLYGVWSVTTDQGLVSSVVSNSNGVHKYEILQTFEEKLNWQMTTTYAENGKKKEVIGFRDGTQRNRQVVTRTNTNNNAIVGETIYDYQGRAAITVLPTPIKECNIGDYARLNYRVDFNQNAQGVSYTARDFDADKSNSISCESTTGEMNSLSGASQYYSSQNIGESVHKNYIPNANGYPFTQTEYTADNTGRIKRQGGVGDVHQLDGGHETRYFYAIPHQSQLDRLFGSEVGWNSHYKKNMVIDPNGQGSVSYLDMAGKVIATSIVGNGTTNLTELQSGSAATISYNEDLFGKDANGISLSNTVNAEGTAIEFTREILVTYQSSHAFDYTIDVNQFQACDALGDEICFDCVYDFNFEIRNDCGEVISSSSDPMIGLFTVVGGDPVFSTSCSGTSYNYNTSLTKILSPGVYTVTKKLEINQLAFDAYLKDYIDPDKNKCIIPYATFLADQVALIDYSGCSVDCDDCVASLGDRDEFVAQGKGTVQQYDDLVEQCMAPCNNDYSALNASHSQMLSDVSPDGQYALYTNSQGQIDPSVFPLSVLNTTNELPLSTSTNTYWKYPKTIDNELYYFDEDGQHARVYLMANGTNYIPEVSNTSSNTVFTDNTGIYTTPQNLLNVADFIAAFEPSWANSLITYHPEYGMYTEYKKYDVEDPYGVTSNNFDSRLRAITTYDEAVTLGFIDQNTVSNYTDDAIRNNAFVQYNSTFPSIYDPIHSYGSWANVIKSGLIAKMNIYMTQGGVNYSMIEVATMMNKCGNAMSSINTTPASVACKQMANMMYPSLGYNDAINEEVRNKIWRSFVGFYLSEKEKLINDLVKAGSINAYRWNECIGEDDFANILSQYVNVSNVQSVLQPCGIHTWELYQNKQRRFVIADEEVEVSDPEEAAYQNYLATGKCPLDQSLEVFLQDISSRGDLTNASVDLYAWYPSYGVLYSEILNNTGATIPSSGIPGCTSSSDFNSSSPNSNSLKLTLNVTGDGPYTIRLVRPSGSTWTGSWNEVKGISGVVKVGSINQVTAKIEDANSVVSFEVLDLELTGNGLHLGGCSFKSVCGNNEVSRSLLMLMNAIAIDGQTDAVNFGLSGLSISPSLLISQSLENTLGVPYAAGGNYAWKYSSNSFTLESGVNLIRLNINTPSSINVGNVTSFTDIESEGDHYFKITAHFSSGSPEIWHGEAILDSGSEIQLSMGTCGLPTPVSCRENGHKVRADLEKLFQDILVPLNGFNPNINIFSSGQMTNVILSALASPANSSTGSLSNGTLTFPIDNCQMELVIDPSTGYSFSDLIGVSKLKGVGDLINNEFYDFELTGEVTGGTVLITGTSCLPLKNCEECEDEDPSYLPNYGVNPGDEAYCQSVYTEYLTKVNQYNIWAAANNSAIAPVVPETEFIDNYCYCAQGIINYLNPTHGEAYTDLGSIGTTGSTSVDLVWVKSMGGLYSDKGANVKVDALGNVFTIGEFGEGAQVGNSVMVDFDPGVGVSSLSTSTSGTVFLQKLNSNGSFIWAKSIYGDGDVFEKSMCLDNVGNVYSTGSFWAQKDFDPGTGVYNLHPGYRKSRYLQKLDQNGSLLWVNQGNGAGVTDEGKSVQVDNLGNVYITGQHSTDLDPTVGLANLLAIGASSVVIRKYNSNGVGIWAWHMGGITTDIGYSLTVDVNGNVYTTGSYELTVDFNPMGGLGNVNNLVSNGNDDVFIQKLDANGHFVWAKSIGGTGIDKGLYVKTDPLGNVYIAGHFSGTVDFDPGVGIQSHTSNGTTDVFIQKLDANGNLLWVKTVDGLIYDHGSSLFVDSSGNVYLTGSYESTVDFDPGTGVYNLTANYQRDLFIQKLNTSGSFVWAKSFGGGKNDQGNSITVDNSGNIYTTGWFQDTVDFDPGVGTVNMGAKGNEDVFVLKLNETNVDSFPDFPHISTFCDQAPCVPQTDVLVGYQPLTYEYSNPCSTQLQINAQMNAQILYDDYLDGLITEFTSQYRSHCMGATEELELEYTDKEHHYTLYYYDLAGNLVRTIPPAGVEPLDLSTVGTQIKNDRTNGTHTVKTNHRLATTYTYNSLNQLTKQSVPDHDKIEKQDLLSTEGLHKSMIVNAIQFTDEMHGYASGYIDGTERGVIYKTSDAGQSWTLMNGVLGSDLKAIQMVDALNGFAVGNSGIFIKTIDGGGSWDLIDLYSLNITGSFNDVYFESANIGMLVGDDGLVLRVDFSNLPYVKSNAFTTDKNITSVGYSSSGSGTYFVTANTDASGNNPAYGQIYTNTGSLADINNWTTQDISAPETDCMYYCSSTTTTWAGGENGLLINSTNNGALWTRIATDANGSFKDLYFFDTDNGVAIIDDGVNSYIYATYNGGLNWSVLNTNYQYNSVTKYEETATLGKAILAGDNGALAHVLVSPGTPFGVSPISNPYTNASPQIDFNKAIHHTQYGKTSIVVAGDDGYVYLCDDFYVINPNWLAPKEMGNGHSIEKLAHKVYSSGTQVVVALNDIGELRGGRYLPVTTSWTQILHLDPGTIFGDITKKGAGIFIGIPKDLAVGGSLISLSYPGGGLSYITVNSSKALTNIKTVKSVSNSEYVFVAENGYEAGVLTTTGSFTTAEAGDKIVSLPLNSLEVTSLKGVIVGENGTVISTDLTTGYKTRKTPSYLNLNDVAINGNDIVVCGDQGVLMYGDLSASSISYTHVTHSETEDFNAVVANSVNTIYAVGDNQTILYVADYTNTSVINSSTGANTIGNLQDVAFMPSSNAFLIVGDESQLYNGFGSFLMKNNALYVRELNDHHFYDTDHGYVIGENYTVRYTQNGGVSWETVLPDAGFSSNVPILKTVEMLSSTTGIMLGENLYGDKLNQSQNAISISTPTVSGLIVRDMAFSSATKGLMIGGMSSPKAYKTVDGGDHWTQVLSGSLGADVLNGLHAFPGTDTYFAVGDVGAAWSINLSGGGATVTNNSAGVFENLNAVTFTNPQTVYAVGTGGSVVQGTNITYNNNNITNIDWAPKFVNELGQSSNNHISCLDFVSPNMGMIGGDLIGSTVPYLAYRIKFEDSKYSGYFYYDALGRLVASQNARQYNMSPRRYSYTLYDELGRIMEVGEKEEPTNNLFKDVFGVEHAHGIYPDVINHDKFLSFINGAGDRRQVTQTHYDDQLPWMTQTQNNLRHRVASVTTEELYDGDDETYNHATHYSYDIHGNVNSLYQENPETGQVSQQFKQLDYEYDLVSGNVNQVNYQKEKEDAWSHKYEYDADNRIIEVETSEDGIVWDMDAKYHYYDHGPLARVELGQNNVQGLDYAYTIKGWLKGVNSNALKSTTDIGKDGASSGANGLFAKDVVGFTLGYFEEDYEAIGGSHFEAVTGGSNLFAARNDLYNGNIGHMVTTIVENPGSVSDLVTNQSYNASPQGMAYKYDQLNRIQEALAFDNMDINSNAWLSNGATVANKYLNNFTYDANGNILTQNRHDADGVVFDNLVYDYHNDAGKLLSNRLYHYNDNNSDSRSLELQELTSSFDNVNLNGNNNFEYDEIGNLVRDNQEDITHINWRVDGKIESIVRSGTIASNKNLKFEYDAMGNRVAKHIYDANSNVNSNTWILNKSVYYVRDATGNVMATYEKEVDNMAQAISYDLVERPIYGSSRLGMYTEKVDVLTIPPASSMSAHMVGKRKYEISNHLGNVLSVITDQKIGIDTDGNQIIDYSLPIVTNVYDYYAFGSAMRERSFDLKMTSNGTIIPTIIDQVGIQVNGDEITDPNFVYGWNTAGGASEEFIYGNGYVERTISGTLSSNYGVVLGLSYQNLDEDKNSIDYAIWSSGTGWTYLLKKGSGNQVGAPYVLGDILRVERKDGVIFYYKNGIVLGSVTEDPTHIGEPLQVDFAMSGYGSTIYGLKMSGAGEAYRYGFGGVEKDDEVKGSGNSLDFLFRTYDPRLGRFLSLDPLQKNFPALTPYQYAGNSPIIAIDLEGLEPATINPNTQTLVLVLQGYGGDPQNGKTQAQNAGGNLGVDNTGLGQIAQAASGSTTIQVVTYASSSTNNTKEDVKKTIEAFKAQNSGGQVVIVGHSGGGDNAIELAKDNPNLTIDLLITLDTQDPKPYGIDDNNIGSNVKNVINYYQNTEGIGSETLDFDKPTNGANILSPGSNHRSIDNDQVGNIITDINNFIQGIDAVGAAAQRTQPTYNPASSGSPDIGGAAGTIKDIVNPKSSR